MMPEVYRRAAAATIAAVLVGLGAAGCSMSGGEGGHAEATLRLTETRRLMGVPWTVTIHAPNASTGRAALAAAFAEVERLERILSDYDPDSELSRLSASTPTAAPVPVSDDLWHVLARAAEITAASGGAFDVTVGPLTTLWRQARRSERLPRPEKLAAAIAAVGPSGLVLDPSRRRVELLRADMRLDLGGIGMGYAADRVLEVLERHGIRAALVDASGDVVASAPPPGAADWRVRVAGLAESDECAGTVLLARAAVTTSGDARQGVEIEGRRYSHIVDPRTGLGVEGPAAVTVIAPDGITADAVATAASVLGPADGGALVARIPGCSARFVWIEAGTTRSHTTPGWPRP
jgi:FAD:protein FMN transferase